MATLMIKSITPTMIPAVPFPEDDAVDGDVGAKKLRTLIFFNHN